MYTVYASTIIILFVALSVTFFVSLVRLMKAIKTINSYRVILFKGTINQINVGSEAETPPSGYPEKRLWFNTIVLPTFVLSLIFFYGIKFFMDQPMPNGESLSWVYSVVIYVEKWLQSYLNYAEFKLINIGYPVSCCVLLFIIYKIYTNKLVQIEYYVSQKLFISVIYQKNKLLDGSVLINLNETLQSTSDKMIEFINHLESFSNMILEEKQNHKSTLYEVDKRLKMMKDTITEFVSFSDNLSNSLCNNIESSFSSGRDRLERDLDDVDSRITKTKETLSEFSSFSDKLTEDLCTSIRESFASGRHYIENQIQAISVEILTQSFSHLFTEASAVMTETGKGLKATSLIMRGIAEEFNTSMKTYEWFNKTAIKAAIQLKGASNDFCVAVQPFNKMINQVNDEMVQSSIYLKQMAYSVMQEVSDAVGKKIEREIEYRDEWMHAFTSDFINKIEDVFYGVFERIIQGTTSQENPSDVEKRYGEFIRPIFKNIDNQIEAHLKDKLDKL